MISGSFRPLENDSYFRHGRASSRPSTSSLLPWNKDVDARHKAGHDDENRKDEAATVSASRPFALAEHGNAPAVGMDAVDVRLIRADHPVDVDKTLVAALRRDLLGGELVAADATFRIALAERNVAGGVLVEKGVQKKQAAFG